MKSINLKRVFFIIFYTLFAILINTLGSVFAGKISFPLYLDSILTISVAALCGLIPAIICAMISNGILAFWFHTALPFMLCHICTAVLAWIIFKYGKKEDNLSTTKKQNEIPLDLFMWAGLASALSNTTLGSSFSNFIFKGNTTIPQVDNAVQGIYVVTQNLPFAVYLGGTLTNLVDKALSALICFIVYKIIKKVEAYIA